MKTFLYKFTIVLIGLFLLFELTIGTKLKSYERSLRNIVSKQFVEEMKIKAREEMEIAVNKDIYLDPKDAELISKFLKKVQKEENLKLLENHFLSHYQKQIIFNYGFQKALLMDFR